MVSFYLIDFLFASIDTEIGAFFPDPALSCVKTGESSIHHPRKDLQYAVPVYFPETSKY